MTSPAPTRPHRTSQVCARPVLGGLAAALIALGGCGGNGDQTEAGGPLVAVGLSASKTTVAFPQRVGKPLMFGLTLVSNEGDQPLTLDRVSFVDPPEGLRTVETAVAGPDRKSTITADPEWPSPRYPDVDEVAGFTVPAGAVMRDVSAELLLITRADEPGDYRTTRVAVEYHVGKQAYRRVIRSGFVACYRAAGAKLACPPDITEDQ